MIHITNTKDFENTIESGITLVDFYASWCGPCRMLSPIIEEIDEEYVNRVKVAKLDVDECGEVASRYHVNAIPAVLIFKNNELVKTNIGFTSKDNIKELLEEILSE